MEKSGLYNLFIGNYSYNRFLKEVIVACEYVGITDDIAIYKSFFARTRYCISASDCVLKLNWCTLSNNTAFLERMKPKQEYFDLYKIFIGQLDIGYIIYIATIIAVRTSNPRAMIAKLINNFSYPIITNNNGVVNINTVFVNITSSDIELIIKSFYSNKSYLKLSIGEVLLPISL